MDVTVDLTAAPPRVALADPDDLASFKVLAQSSEPDPARLAQALHGVGTLAEGGHAFIAVDAVRLLAGDRAGDPEWSAGLERMLAYADSKGWMDPSGTAIQAHIEWSAV
jgi:hypothetical protein